jgi:predicted amidohydrolase
MEQLLKITLIQTHLIWENVDVNISHFDKLIDAISESSDVIILPEMFSAGFSMNISIAESMGGKSMKWLSRKAAEKNVAICGSLMIEENGMFYNRFTWMNPDGTFQTYNKRHCFRMANEHNYFTPGDEKIIIDYKGFKICPMVCYDLRFPVWSRNKIVDNEYAYDVLIYVANWPERREFAWQQLLIARAIENLSFVVGVNRVGKDGFDIDYSGQSAIINMLGQKLTSLQSHKTAIETITINKTELQKYREQFPAHLDADAFEIVL